MRHAVVAYSVQLMGGLIVMASLFTPAGIIHFAAWRCKVRRTRQGVN
jgi:hypothetical protein